MSIRMSILAILDQGPCYGYQLKAEFETRTGGSWPVNVGQVYSTLERLERDGLVTKAQPVDGQIRYSITEAGSVAVAAWFATPVERHPERDELAVKLALASSLEGVDLAEVIDSQRSRSIENPTHGVASRITALATAVSGRSDEAFLDAVLALHLEVGDASIPLTTGQPRRGRPVGS